MLDEGVGHGAGAVEGTRRPAPGPVRPRQRSASPFASRPVQALLPATRARHSPQRSRLLSSSTTGRADWSVPQQIE